jgi:hypothetical protein
VADWIQSLQTKSVVELFKLNQLMLGSVHHGVAPGPKSADADLVKYLLMVRHAIKFKEVHA